MNTKVLGDLGNWYGGMEDNGSTLTETGAQLHVEAKPRMQ
jgi:hypothetical protein